MAYQVSCQCGQVTIHLNNKPIVHANCHCDDCRSLLGVPYHAVTAWKKEDVAIEQGEVEVYQHPSLNMQKHFCKNCGDVLFNTNGMDWRVVAQQLIAKNYDKKLPSELASDKHFFYEQRVVDVKDDLPKYLRGTNGPLYSE